MAAGDEHDRCIIIDATVKQWRTGLCAHVKSERRAFFEHKLSQ